MASAPPYQMPSSSTARMGPTLHRATRPKLSSWDSRSPRMEAMPMPKAIIKGTVIGPVVTPPESKATDTNSLGMKMERMNTKR